MPGWMSGCSYLALLLHIEEFHPGFIYLESSDLFGGGVGRGILPACVFRLITQIRMVADG